MSKVYRTTAVLIFIIGIAGAIACGYYLGTPNPTAMSESEKLLFSTNPAQYSYLIPKTFNYIIMLSALVSSVLLGMIFLAISQIIDYQVCMQNLLLGGHVRMGMEDNLWLSKGKMAQNNAQLVEKLVRIMKEFDYDIATPDEAREILGLKK
jgi:hypothetical protein